MTGRAAVSRHQQRLDAVFNRVNSLPPDAEVRSDFARYLCVLVSGFLETAISELLVEHSRQCGSPSLQRFVEARTSSFTNAKVQKILDILGTFDTDWRIAAEVILRDEYKDAIDSVVALRNSIAHGGNNGITYIRIKEYYDAIKLIISRIADIILPQ